MLSDDNSWWVFRGKRYARAQKYLKLQRPTGLRDNVRCSSWAHWKARTGLPIILLVLIELFSLGVMAEALKAKADVKIGDFAPTRSVWPQISGSMGRPTNYFWINSLANECITTLSLTVFTQRNFVADCLQAKCDFRRKMAVLRFWAPPPWGIRSNVRWSSYAHWKARKGRLPISVNWTFFARCYMAETLRLRAIIGSKLAILLQSGWFVQKFQVEGVTPTILFLRKLGKMIIRMM